MNKKQSYQELLKDPRWIKKRNEILARDKNTCQFCGKHDRYMHVHHKNYTYAKKPWEYDNSELVCLCEKCHKNVTDDSKQLYEVFLYARDCFRKYGFSDSILKELLTRIGWCVDSIRCGEYEKVKWFEDALDDAVLSIQSYEDIKTLAKIGIRHQGLVDFQFPMFSNDYALVEKDKNIVLSEKEK